MKSEIDSTPDFSKAGHTIVISDLHLCEAEPPHPRRPLWKKYKRAELFMDEELDKFHQYLDRELDGPIELVLNGDIFDFDSVMAQPTEGVIKSTWLERKRGLFAEDEKSLFKMKIILRDHEKWVNSLRNFLLKGHRLIFIIGNHDIELHWPRVQKEIIKALNLPESHQSNVRFCEWFYLSNKDTLIEHGNQYDAFTICQNPINPLIRPMTQPRVRLPFGNLAGRFMINGMGYFNPHVDSSFIRGSFKEYVEFYFKYIIKTEPFIIFTWFWGAMATLLYALREAMLPALVDPLTVVERVEFIAKKSNATTQMVRALRAVHVHPAIFHPMLVLKELWLDRAFLLMIIVASSFQFVGFVNIFVRFSPWWILLFVVLVLPFFIMYAQTVEASSTKLKRVMVKKITQSATITGVERVVVGHTHTEGFIDVGGVELINCGTWSPAFKDIECTIPLGQKCFVWIRPEAGREKRFAELLVWKEGKGSVLFCSEENQASDWTD